LSVPPARKYEPEGGQCPITCTTQPAGSGEFGGGVIGLAFEAIGCGKQAIDGKRPRASHSSQCSWHWIKHQGRARPDRNKPSAAAFAYTSFGRVVPRALSCPRRAEGCRVWRPAALEFGNSVSPQMVEFY
jgi:hypothetical protein